MLKKLATSWRDRWWPDIMKIGHWYPLAKGEEILEGGQGESQDQGYC